MKLKFPLLKEEDGMSGGPGGSNDSIDSNNSNEKKEEKKEFGEEVEINGKKFMVDKAMAEAINAATGLELDASALEEVTLRTFLRGYRLERLQGMDETDYRMPARAHEEHPTIDLPYFNSLQFFEHLRTRVSSRLEALLESSDLEPI